MWFYCDISVVQYQLFFTINKIFFHCNTKSRVALFVMPFSAVIDMLIDYDFRKYNI